MRRKDRQRHWYRKELIRIHGGKCALCGELVTLKDGDPLYATIDHVVPLSRGGLDIIQNMQLAHAACNEEKGDTE